MSDELRATRIVTGTEGPKPLVLKGPAWVTFLRGPLDPLPWGDLGLRRGERIYLDGGSYRFPAPPPAPRAGIDVGYHLALSVDPEPAEQWSERYLPVQAQTFVPPNVGAAAYAERVLVTATAANTVVTLLDQDGTALAGVQLDDGGQVTLDLPTNRQANLRCDAGAFRALFLVEHRFFVTPNR